MNLFEKFMWKSRYMTFLPVIFGLVVTFLMFIVASYDICRAMVFAYKYLLLGDKTINLHAEDGVGLIVGAIDLYLMALVFFIFSFGIYELFINSIDVFKSQPQGKELEVGSLDELKDKIGKVIVMVLVVNFFQRALNLEIKTSLDMIYLALSILAICLGLYLLHKSSAKKYSK